jgi:hypothetical protein
MAKERTTIAILPSTRDRLKTRYAHYGDTLDTIIVELMDFKDKWKDTVSKLEGDKHE